MASRQRHRCPRRVGLDEERGDPYEDEEDPDQGQRAVAAGRERDHDAHEDEQDADRDAVGEIEDVGDGEEPECAGDEQDEAEPARLLIAGRERGPLAPTAISAIGQMYFQARKSDQISSARKNAPRTTKARPRATAPPVRSRAGAAAVVAEACRARGLGHRDPADGVEQEPCPAGEPRTIAAMRIRTASTPSTRPALRRRPR